MTRKNRLTLHHRRALRAILPEPAPEYSGGSTREAADVARLRAAFSRFESEHGADALISALKTELIARGEERWRLDQMAPHPGTGGQTSLLDFGR